MKKELTGQDGTKYSVHHMRSHKAHVRVEIDGTDYCVPVTVKYSSHCYTRTLGDGEPAGIATLVEGNRVLCPDRWSYSFGLKGAVQSLCEGAQCRMTDNKHIVLKFNREGLSTESGWYIFVKTKITEDSGEARITLWVESCHHRKQPPTNSCRKRPQIRYPLYLRNLLVKKFGESLSRLLAPHKK